MNSQVFILRMHPTPPCHKKSKRWYRVPDALEKGHLIIGWAKARGLLDPELSWEKFRDRIQNAYSECYGENRRKSGPAAGEAWRFIRCMNEGDLVVVPDGKEFHFGRVASGPWFDENEVEANSAYRRKAEWLKRGVPRDRDGLAVQAYIKEKAKRGTIRLVRDKALAEEICEFLGFKSADPEGREWDGIRHGREGEGPNHKRLRLWVRDHASKVDPDYASFRTKTEYVLDSADRVDVVFCGPRETVVIEVKSSDSNETDLRRGVFQCIKYRAVMEAMVAHSETTVTAILVTQVHLPSDLVDLARLHRIRLFRAPPRL